jgi:enoyl-CoA hydratase
MEIYLEITERWRNLSKPIVAQVQGKCVTGGLMLAWCSDFVIASDDAQFICTSTKMGGTGVEFWAYPWEIGPRRAKQWMLMGELSAEKAERFGMVNEVVPRAELEKYTLEFAERLCAHTSWTLNMTKATVNQTQDIQGRRNSMHLAFAVHQLGHAHRVLVHGAAIDPNTLPENIRAHFDKRQAAAGG